MQVSSPWRGRAEKVAHAGCFAAQLSDSEVQLCRVVWCDATRCDAMLSAVLCCCAVLGRVSRSAGHRMTGLSTTRLMLFAAVPGVVTFPQRRYASFLVSAARPDETDSVAETRPNARLASTADGRSDYDGMRDDARINGGGGVRSSKGIKCIRRVDGGLGGW